MDRREALPPATPPELAPPGPASGGHLAAAATTPQNVPTPPIPPVQAAGATTRYESDAWFTRAARWATGGWTPWLWVASVFAAAEAGFVADLGGWPMVIAIVVTVVVWGKAPQRLRQDDEVTFARRATLISGAWLTVASQQGPFTQGVLLAGLALAAFGMLRYRTLRHAWRKRQNVPAPAPALVAAPEPAQELEPVQEPVLDGIVMSPEQALIEAHREQMQEIAERNRQLAWLKTVEIVEAATYSQGCRYIVLQLVGGVHTTGLFTDTVLGLFNTGFRRADGRPLRHGAVSMQLVPENSTQVVIHIRDTDPLTKVIQFEDIEHEMPSTVQQPQLLGKLADHTLNMVSLLYFHVLIGGTTRGGKSNTVHTLIANLAKCVDALIFVIDMKGGRAGGPWLPRVDWLATDPDEAIRMLRFVKGVMDYRAMHSDHSKDKHIPTPEAPAIFVFFDECAQVIGNRSEGLQAVAGPLCEEIASLGAGLAVHLILATQWPDLSSVYTNVLRGNLLLNICHAMKDPTGGSFLLGNDAYHRLDPTMLSEKGSYYIRVEKASALAGRTPLMCPDNSNEQITRIARRTAHLAPQMEAGAQQAGEALCDGAYATRAERLNRGLIRSFLKGCSYGGFSYQQLMGVPEEAIEGATAGGSSAPVPQVPAGVPGEVPAEVPGEVPAGVPETVPVPSAGGFPGDAVEGFPGGSPSAADGGAAGVPGSPMISTAVAALADDDLPEVDESQLTAEQLATVRDRMAEVTEDTLKNAAFDGMALALAKAPERGLKFHELVAASGFGETWVKQRTRLMLAHGSLYHPGGVQGRYAAERGAHRADILHAFWVAQWEIDEGRRQEDLELAGAAS
uniref:FtsK/SpoIIIE domain-containing protein n=1 Tax=Nonomuraea sp. CA-251285 TaxID=3240002 RepID=UPI003F491970